MFQLIKKVQTTGILLFQLQRQLPLLKSDKKKGLLNKQLCLKFHVPVEQDHI